MTVLNGKKIPINKDFVPLLIPDKISNRCPELTQESF
jgi:hypothetical protein